MIRIPLIIMSAWAFYVCSCRLEVQPAPDPHWKKHQLPNGWSFWAPTQFRSHEAHGVDSRPGYIISDKDSIYLKFDSAIDLVPKNRKCILSNEFNDAKKNLQDGWYKEFYKISTLHTGYVDTIDNKAAIIIKPLMSEKGTVGVSIKDCETGAWLRIDGENLSKQNEVLVLSIFKTISFDRKFIRH